MGHSKRTHNLGFTLVEVIVSVVVLLSVGYVVVSAVQHQSAVEKRVRSAESLQAELSPILGRSVAVLKNIGPESNQGICKFLDADRLIGGVGEIFLKLPPESSDALNSEWTNAFDGSPWVIAPNVCRGTLYKRCFNLNPTHPSASQSLVSEDAKLEVSLNPARLRSWNNQPFSLISIHSDSTLNARDNGFVISAKLFKIAQTGDEEFLAHDFRLLWPGEVTCQKMGADNQPVTISVSGMGSGLSSRFLLSSSLGAPELSDKFLNVSFVHRVRSTSELKDGLIQAVRTDEESYAFQCGEERFRCPNSAAPRSWNPSMFGRLDVRYIPRNSRIEATSVYTYNQLCFGKSESDNHCPVAQEIRNNQGVARNLNEPLFFTEHRQGVRVTIEDSRGSCNSICGDRPGVKYNRLINSPRDDKSQQLYRAFFRSIYIQDTRIAQWDADPKPVGCACCYKKQCSAYSLNPTGNCNNQPTEPLDSKIPECESEQSQTIAVAFERASPQNHNKCVVAELSIDGTLLTYKTSDCSLSFPAACYFQGAVKISKDMQGSPLRRSFDEASVACAELGRLKVEAAPFREYLRQQANASTEYNVANLPPEQNGFYNYIDNAHAGLFFNPHSDHQINTLIASMKESSVERVWVPLKTDEKGYLFPIPAKSPGLYSPYVNYNYKGNQTFKKDPDHGFRSGNSALVLAHHRRWLSAIPVSESQPEAKLPAICLNSNGEVFVSRFFANNLNEADIACRSNNGIFLPPMNSSLYTQALLRLSPPAFDLPWPVTDKIAAAWLPFTSSTQPRIQLNTATGVIYSDGSAVQSNLWEVDYIICRTGESQFELRPKSSVCLNYAGTDLSLTEKWEIRFLIFKQHGVNSTYRYSLVAPPKPPTQPSFR